MTPNFDAIEYKPHAKLNLSLEILGKRDDKYHEIRTVMVPINLYDHLHVTRKDFAQERVGLICMKRSSSIRCDPKDIPWGEDNLAYEAAMRFFRKCPGLPGGVQIEIAKQIPTASGLGGGSSNAAYVIKSLGALYDIKDPGLFHQIAREVGSDISFFLDQKPALCQGKGDLLTPLPPMCLDIVILNCGTRCLTKEAYSSISPDDFTDGKKTQAMVQAFEDKDLDMICSLLYNVFEPWARRANPEIEALYRHFQGHLITTDSNILENLIKPKGILLSGTGSSVFGIYEDRSSAAKSAMALRKYFQDRGEDVMVECVRTLNGWKK